MEDVLLWWHVSKCALIVMEIARVIFAIDGGCKAKISKFKVILFIHHNIFWLNVSMAYSHICMKIIQRWEHLDEVESRNVLTEGFATFYKVEKIAIFGVFHNYENNQVWLFMNRWFEFSATSPQYFIDKLVVQRADSIDFIKNHLIQNGFMVPLWAIFHYFASE